MGKDAKTKAATKKARQWGDLTPVLLDRRYEFDSRALRRIRARIIAPAPSMPTGTVSITKG